MGLFTVEHPAKGENFPRGVKGEGERSYAASQGGRGRGPFPRKGEGVDGTEVVEKSGRPLRDRLIPGTGITDRGEDSKQSGNDIWSLATVGGYHRHPGQKGEGRKSRSKRS